MSSTEVGEAGGEVPRLSLVNTWQPRGPRTSYTVLDTCTVMIILASDAAHSSPSSSPTTRTFTYGDRE